jgi:sporadic carbohydrate cluster protein (TIGR04323 family)
MNKVRGYIFSREFMGERVPQHVQNLVIRDYCERNHLQFLLSATEYAMPKSHLIFEQILDELTNIHGLVAYSLFQLPEEKKRRIAIYEKVIAQKKSLHFAVEGLHMITMQQCEQIERIWQIRLTLPLCLKNFT